MAAEQVRSWLRETLGLWGTTRVFARMLWYKLRGYPFGRLPAPVDERERLSRLQCGDIVLLDRAVRGVAGAGAGLEVSRRAVLAGGAPFLDAMIPPLPDGGLGAFAQTVAARFFNAEGEAAADESARTFSFTVTRCRFVELLHAVDAAHLAPLFCEVDDAYFETGKIALERTSTLAGGGACCDFRFRLRG